MARTKTTTTTAAKTVDASSSVEEIVNTASVGAVDLPVTASAAAPAPAARKPKAAKVAAAVAAPALENVTVSIAESTVITADGAAAATATAAAAVVDEKDSLFTQSSEFFAKLQSLGNHISALKTEYRTLEKKWTRELKLAQKQSSKRKRKAGSRAPSGFVKPTRISDELSNFLEKPSGSEMARTEVTREINQYIRTHNLQDKVNGRKINPDSKLASLLKLKKSDVLTYFNLQKYMSPHFAKAVKAATAETEVEVEASVSAV